MIKDIYNLKIVKYNEQTNISLFEQPVVIQGVYKTFEIQMKRFRTLNCVPSLKVGKNYDNTYICTIDKNLLDNSIDDYLVRHELPKKYKEQFIDECGYTFSTKLQNEEYKKERSQINSINRTKSSVYDISYSNTWSHFLTLTFSDDELFERYGNYGCNR